MQEIKDLIACAVEIYKKKASLSQSQLTESSIREKFHIEQIVNAIIL